MKRWTKHRTPCLLAWVALLCSAEASQGYDINDKFSIGGVFAGAYQYQDTNEDGTPGFGNGARGAIPLQPEITFRLTEKDEFSAKFGFAAGNALKQVDPAKPSFALAPWAADLEDDVKNINGRNRDYLLTAWYKHTFRFSEDHFLGITGGIIDATEYVDKNAYANDEFTQFMNEALVNGPNVFAPSYDIGGAVEWAIGSISAKGVAMGVGENDDGNSYNYYALQLGFHPKTVLGNGNYRVVLATTTKDFLDPSQAQKEARKSILLSFDQELGEVLGVWLRFGWADDGPALAWKTLYSGGIDIKGSCWNREKDNIGIGYARLSDGNQDWEKSKVLEGYYRFVFNEYLAATADVQYMKDEFHDGGDLKGWVIGIRLPAEF